MKIVAINEIHYIDAKTGKSKVAQPGEVIDRPKDEADRLCAGALPAARKLTDAEIEIDKLRAEKIAASAVIEGEDEDEDEDENEGKSDAKTETKTAAKSAAKTETTAAAKVAAKDSGEGY